MAALKAFVDVDKVLTAVSCRPTYRSSRLDGLDHSDPYQAFHSACRTINQQRHCTQTIRKIDPSDLRSIGNHKK